MLGAIYIGLSGLDAYSKGLQTISNNVANLNTPGFKTNSVNFTDLFSYGGGGLSYSGGTSAQQAGGGVMFGSPQIDFKQGDLRQSNGDLDLAIQGSGFLVLINGDKTYYARTGQFAVDKEGYISEQGTGYHLAILNDARQPVAINIDAKRTSNPAATTKITFADNIQLPLPDAGVSVGNIAVYDSAGGKHVWQVNIKSGGTNAPDRLVVSVLDETGAMVTVADDAGVQVSAVTGTLKVVNNRIDATASTVTLKYTPPGANELSVVLDFTAATNFASTASTVRASSTDGNGVGALVSVTVDDTGQIKLTYSNEKTELAGAVALADFRDAQQLQRVGNGLFESKTTGEHRLLASGIDGIGKLVSKQTEASNVDLSAEFGDLILIQRGFQASSQVISVANDMIQQLFGIRGQG